MCRALIGQCAAIDESIDESGAEGYGGSICLLEDNRGEEEKK